MSLVGTVSSSAATDGSPGGRRLLRVAPQSRGTVLKAWARTAYGVYTDSQASVFFSSLR